MTRQAFLYVGSDPRSIVTEVHREALLESVAHDEEFEVFQSLAMKLLEKLALDYSIFLNPPDED
jgi:hypothetical protein